MVSTRSLALPQSFGSARFPLVLFTRELLSLLGAGKSIALVNMTHVETPLDPGPRSRFAGFTTAGRLAFDAIQEGRADEQRLDRLLE